MTVVTPQPLKLAIVGKGAIGGLLASRCQQLNYDYQLLLRAPQSPSLSVSKAQTLSIQNYQGARNTFTPKTSIIGHNNDFDIVILPIKVYQVAAALQSLRSCLKPQNVIVLLHNGMGTIEKVKTQFPHTPCIAGTTSYGAYKPDSMTISETGLGETHLGWITHPEPSTKIVIETLLAKLLPPTYWHQDISLALWKKLTINAVINPLTAIHQVKNGELATRRFTDKISAICGEISSIMNKLGYYCHSSDLITLVKDVINKTADNYSSMYQDVLHKRRTEIEFINGYIVKKANDLCLQVPQNQTLLKQVLDLESK